MALDGTEAGLTASVADWLNRDDLTSQIADFKIMARNRISRDLRIAAMQRVETSLFDDGEVTLPIDCVELQQVLAGSPLRPLTKAGLDFVADTYLTSVAGVPVFYTVTGSTIKTYPSAGEGAVQIVCYVKLDSTWLLANAPELYLYATLIESAPFLGDDNRVGVWGTMYNQAKDAIRKQDTLARYSGASTRVRGPTP